MYATEALPGGLVRVARSTIVRMLLRNFSDFGG